VLKTSKTKSLILGVCLLFAASTCLAEQLPRLVDVGADNCIPCKLMAPILEELKGEYTGRMDVMFVDAWEKPEEAQKYGVQMIPTQIFYDAQGKELFRRTPKVGMASDKFIVTVCPHRDRAILAMSYLHSKGIPARYRTDGLIGLAENLRGDSALYFMEAISELK